MDSFDSGRMCGGISGLLQAASNPRPASPKPMYSLRFVMIPRLFNELRSAPGSTVKTISIRSG